MPRCTHDGALADLAEAVNRQRGRRGIVAVRELLPLVDGRAESVMESEARLVMLDHGLPRPELQYVIHGNDGERWRGRLRLAGRGVAAEYESVEFHSGAADTVRDRKRIAGIQEMGWILVPIVAGDVRRTPARMCERLRRHLQAV